MLEVHRELSMVRNGAKDMVTKNKHLKKKEKYAQSQLVEAQRRITYHKLTWRNPTQQNPRSYRRKSTDSPPTSPKHKKQWKSPKRKLAGYMINCGSLLTERRTCARKLAKR